MTKTISVWKITFGYGMPMETCKIVSDDIDHALSRIRNIYRKEIKDMPEEYKISKIEHLLNTDY